MNRSSTKSGYIARTYSTDGEKGISTSTVRAPSQQGINVPPMASNVEKRPIGLNEIRYRISGNIMVPNRAPHMLNQTIRTMMIHRHRHPHPFPQKLRKRKTPRIQQSQLGLREGLVDN